MTRNLLTNPINKLKNLYKNPNDNIDINFEYWLSRLRSRYCGSYNKQLNSVQYIEEYAPTPEHINLIQSAEKGNPKIFFSTGYQTILNYLCELEDNKYNPLSMNSILEFGTGYARLLRHFIPLEIELYGCDITKEPIQWCKENIGEYAQFDLTNTMPPLPYKDKMFDFIFANSVFTHIQYSNTIEWINELYRVTKPGGCVITSHYDMNEHLRNFDATILDHAICEKGYIEWGKNSVRENHIFFSYKKLFEIWGRNFEILQYRNHFKDQSHLIVRRT